MTPPRIARGLIGILLLAGMLVSMESFAPASAADTSMVTPAATSMVIPVKAARPSPICKRFVRCTGCKPVYRCRVCRKRPICTHGVCIYRPTCGWGPALNALPSGARVVNVR